MFILVKGAGNLLTFGFGNLVHQCHVLGYVILLFEDPEDDHKQQTVSLGFSTGKNRPNTAGVQIGLNLLFSNFLYKKEEKDLTLMNSHSKSQYWETFTKQDEKITVECKFDNENHSIVHFKFSNR